MRPATSIKQRLAAMTAEEIEEFQGLMEAAVELVDKAWVGGEHDPYCPLSGRADDISTAILALARS